VADEPLQVKPFVAGVILAAGRSERFLGRPKQLLDWDGEPLVVRAVRTALRARLAQVVVVLGHAADEIAAAIDEVCDPDRGALKVILNPAYAEGLATSVRAGLARVDPVAQAVMFFPADQPLLTRALVDRLIAAYAASPKNIVLPTAAGRRGAPVLWDRTLFDALEALEGDTGGRQVLKRYASDVLEVEAAAQELADLDTETDYRRLAQSL
jgi:molybdenum cofactor cytidylyltransferase